MDNQPIPTNTAPQRPVSQPNAQSVPTMPSANPTPSASPISTTPVTPVPPVTPASPVQPIASTATSSQPASPKKKSKGLLIGIICAAVLLVGGAIAAFIIIKTQPSNIIASSINNLINAKHVSVEGNINIATDKTWGDNYINIDLAMLGSESNYSTTAQAKISLPMLGLYSPVTIETNEVLISDGKIYAKVKGVKEALTRQNIVAVGGSYINDNTINLIQGIGEILEDRWIMISLEEILNSELYNIDEDKKQEILSTYNCVKDKINNISNYSNEISDIYKNNSFTNMEQQPDSFYSISFDPEKLANFGNSIPKTKLFQDLANCASEDTEVVDSTNFTPESAKIFIEKMPNISAKFDGFMDYHLSELRINSDANYFTVSTDLKFNYDGTDSVSIPSEFTSITDVINEIMVLSSQATTYTSQNCPPDANCVSTEVVVEEEDYNF